MADALGVEQEGRLHVGGAQVTVGLACVEERRHVVDTILICELLHISDGFHHVLA